MMKPKARLFFPLFAIAALGLAGCVFPFNILGDNVAVLARTPRPVPNKITHPERPDARLAVLWVGHATALVQIDDKFILTDPVFTDTVGELSKRLVEPGIEPRSLPPIDAVIVSHMHFDHLSLGTLEMLEPKIKTAIVPAPGLVYVPDFSFDAVQLCTWQSWEQGGLRITAVPVQHSGFRYGADRAWMDTSYTGYVVEYHGISVYFGGDTGYNQENFTSTRRRFPSLDLALLPIAPIHPREHMKSRHIDPPEALQTFRDLGAKTMIPIHFDTFINSTDAPGEAVGELRRLVAEQGITTRVKILAHGEQHVVVKR